MHADKRRWLKIHAKRSEDKPLHQFVQAGIATITLENPDRPPTAKTTMINQEALDAIKTYGTKRWAKALDDFKRDIGTLKDRYEKERVLRKYR